MASPYDAYIDQYADQFGVPRNIAYGLTGQESGFRPGVTSSAGARGLMQIMPGTAAQYGVRPEQLFDPETNIRTGLRYYADMLHRFGGDHRLALIAYNAGPGWAQRVQQGQINYQQLPHETQAYVPGVLSRAGQPAVTAPPRAIPSQSYTQAFAGIPPTVLPQQTFPLNPLPGYSARNSQSAAESQTYGDETGSGPIAGSGGADLQRSPFAPIGQFGFGSTSPYDFGRRIDAAFANAFRGYPIS